MLSACIRLPDSTEKCIPECFWTPSSRPKIVSVFIILPLQFVLLLSVSPFWCNDRYRCLICKHDMNNHVFFSPVGFAEKSYKTDEWNSTVLCMNFVPLKKILWIIWVSYFILTDFCFCLKTKNISSLLGHMLYSFKRVFMRASIFGFFFKENNKMLGCQMWWKFLHFNKITKQIITISVYLYVVTIVNFLFYFKALL